MAIKRGLSVLNTPGTVDYGYTGEIKVIVFNFTNETQIINEGDKVAQAVVCPVIQGKADRISESRRNRRKGPKRKWVRVNRKLNN